jgi:predicted porin
MKKSLFAIAAVTAFAGAAQAQSSVTVYGLLDVGYTGGNARVNGTRETVGRISNSMESGSRLGVRGNEDLGGGTAAQFVFELGIQPAGNAGSRGPAATTTQSSDGNAGAPNWTPNVRQAFIGFSQKGMGNVRVGTQNTLFWEQAGSNTTGQLAQTLGSMLAPTTDGAFFSTSTFPSQASSVSKGTNGSAFGAYSTRTTNTIRFATDRMAGFIGKAAYTQSNSNVNQTTPAKDGTTGYTGGENNQTGYQVALDYQIQKANIQASYASFKSENPNGAVVWTPVATAETVNKNTSATAGGVAAWGGGVQGQNVTDAQTLITASYDFGILKAFAGWTDRKITSGLNSNNFAKRTAQEIGVRSFITPKIEGWASAGNGRYTSYGAGEPTANITGYQLGSNYYLSKRTNLYAIYGANNTSSTSNGAYNASQYSIGARHTF